MNGINVDDGKCSSRLVHRFISEKKEKEKYKRHAVERGL